VGRAEDDEDDKGNAVPIEELIAKYFCPSPPPVDVEFGALSHPGKVRTTNEDHYVVLKFQRSLGVLLSNLPEGKLSPRVDQDAYVMGVADGMGGAAFGELASMQALLTGVDLCLKDIKWTMKVNESEVRELMEKLDLYFHLINRSLIERARSEPRLAGMGTTLTAAFTVGPEAFIMHAGDSRAYLFHEGTLRRLTRDHTLGQQLVDLGAIEAGSFESRYFRHILTNCLGGPDVEVVTEVHHLSLLDGDRLLLCTDGLTDLVEDDEITRILSQHLSSADACSALVDLALDRGGRDNITVVLGRYTTQGKPEGPLDSTSLLHTPPGSVA
jgi:serine/threonine protein phosphatase PrpC